MGERTRYEPGTFCWVGPCDMGSRSGRAVLRGPVRLGGRGGRGGRGGHVHDAAPAARTWRFSTGSSPRRARRGRRRTGPRTSRSRTSSRALRGPVSSAALRVFREPFDVLDAGRVAAIRASDRRDRVARQPLERIGATLVDDVGALCWNELATTDLERAKAFFAELLGWDYETDDGGYVSIINAGRLNGGMREQAARGTRHPAELAPVLHRRIRRQGGARSRAAGRTHTTADHRNPHRAPRGDRRPAGRRVRGVRGRNRLLTRTGVGPSISAARALTSLVTRSTGSGCFGSNRNVAAVDHDTPGTDEVGRVDPIDADARICLGMQAC